jgi:hypothetical protein
MKRIGEILLERGLISRAQLEEALEAQRAEASRRKLGEILIEKGYLTYDVLIGYLESQIGS